MKTKRLLTCALMLVFFAMSIVVANLTAVNAQNPPPGPGNGFKISPVRYELTLDKGSSEIIKLTIENPTASVINATVIVNDFEVNDNETGEPKILFDPTTSVTSNSFKTIASSIKGIKIDPGAKVELPVTIKIPKEGASGGYYGAVRVVPDNQIDKNVSLAASVGTIFLVKVPGNLSEQLQLAEFTAAKNGSNGRFFINSGNMSIVTRLKNTGNIHVKPFGKIQVTDRSGKIIQEIEFNNTEPRANVLPNSIRKFTDDLNNQKWIGKYNVTANMGYGTSGGLITAKTYFYVIPMWFVIVALLLIVLIVIGIYLIYRKYKMRPIHRSRSRR